LVLFVVLAHRQRDCLIDLINNLQAYCRNSRIVVYNGGTDLSLIEGLASESVMPFPHARPVTYGRLLHLLEVFEWVEDANLAFDYLVSLDADMLLIKDGFEDYLDRNMSAEYWGVGLTVAPVGTVGWSNEPYFAQEFEAVWHPLFQSNVLARVFNPGQVFRRSAVHKIVGYIRSHRQAVDRVIEESRAFAVEEVLYPSLALHSGCKCDRMPRSNTRLTLNRFLAVAWHRRQVDLQMIRYLLWGVKGSIRDKVPFSPREVEEFIRDEDSFLLHPVPLNIDDPVRKMIRTRVEALRR